MTVAAYLSTRPGGWYTPAPSRLDRFRRYELTGAVWGSSDTDLFEIVSNRGTHAVMVVRPVTRQTERKHGGRWKVRFFPNSIEKAREYYPTAHNKTGTAFHEAGHAVIAERLGAGYKIATVEPGVLRVGSSVQLYRGVVRLTEAPDPKTSAIVALSGPLAETVATGEPLNIDGLDLLQLSEYVGDNRERLTDIHSVTGSVVAENWTTISKTAQRLILERTVTNETPVVDR